MTTGSIPFGKASVYSCGSHSIVEVKTGRWSGRDEKGRPITVSHPSQATHLHGVEIGHELDLWRPEYSPTVHVYSYCVIGPNTEDE